MSFRVVISEEAASELANRVIKNSRATLDGTVVSHGFSITTSLSAQGVGSKVIFLDPPAARRMRFENLEIDGAVKITWLKFNPATFAEAIPAVAAGVKAAKLPDIVLNATQLTTLPFEIKKTIDCLPVGAVTPTEAGVKVDVDLPFTPVTLPAPGAELEANITQAILAALKGISVTMPGLPMKIALPDDAQKKIAAAAVEEWRKAWAELTPRLNLGLQELFKRLQIFQDGLALFLAAAPTGWTLAKPAAAIPAVSVPVPNAQPYTWQSKEKITEVKAAVKGVTVEIANHELSAVLTLG